MKISKEDKDNRLTVYHPDDDEKELMGTVSDKIIDLIDSYELNDDQRIHLISSLYESMKDMYGIIGMKHEADSQSD